MNASDEKHAQELEELKQTLGGTPAPAHTSGYLTQDEYATLIYYWAGEEHESDVVDGVIATLANCSWMGITERTLSRAGVLQAFCELYPDKESGWRSAYPNLFRSMKRCIQSPQSDPRWNAFHLMQWFILRRARREEGIDIIDKLLDRVADGGTVGGDALEVLNAAARDCKPFEVALERARAARLQRMVIQ